MLEVMEHKNLTLPEYKRFIKNVIKDECWKWVGKLDKDGYGMFFLRQKLRRAHRVSWYNVNGIIGDDLVIHHKCRNHSCVNPDHLEKMTWKENAALRSPYCKHGHLLDRKYGKQRYCSTCQREKNKRLSIKHKLNPLLKGV